MSPPNILLLVVDTLAADHLSAYGYTRETSRFLEDFGAQGVRFAEAFSQSSHTKSSMASLVTGLLPPTHRVRTGTFRAREDNILQSDVLSNSLTTVAEVLQERGYSTVGFVTNPHLKPAFGFAQGFDDYQFVGSDRDADDLNEMAFAWLKAKRRGPFFVYLHYMDIHAPYKPMPPYRDLYTSQRGIKAHWLNGPLPPGVDQEITDYSQALYDAQINQWDRAFESFVAQLKDGGWLRNTIIVLLADHGEEFGEHGGSGHGCTVYRESTHVPLYFHFEDKLEAGVVREDLVQLVDVAPTLFGLAGISTEGMQLHGVDLFASKDSDPESSVIYSEAFKFNKPRSVRTARHHLIFNEAPGSWEFYDLLEDPAEERDLSKAGSSEMDRLTASLLRLMKGSEAVQTEWIQLDEKTVEALESLGYVR